MKLLAVLLCPVTCALTLLPASAQPTAPAVPQPSRVNPSITTDRVRVLPRVAKLVRGKPGQDYPDYKEAKVQYPQVLGLSDPTVLRKVQRAISLKTVFGKSVEEFRQEFQTESWWLSEIEYRVNYNQNYLLDITFTQSGIGAYPSSFDRQVVVDLRTGKTLTAADLFKPESLKDLTALVNQAMRSQVQQKIAELSKDQDPSDIEFVQTQLERQSFQTQDLNNFSVSDQGITFLYDYGLPHVVKVWEPSGRFFFTYQQLESYLQPEGVLPVNGKL